ncbi:MAG: hypothetical protein HY849_06820 [Nitrosomonadales bacterium]|nr:hypothetical protein [Nitrosomonadales bacterium]
MRFFRLFQPMFFALVLLFAQQAGAAHVLGHLFGEQKQDQQTSHSAACEQCANFAQLGGALGGAAPALALLALSFALVVAPTFAFRSTLPHCALARGPPASL